MTSCYITVRQTASGKRWVVRFRRGGRAFKVEHGGSFRTMKDAKTRRDLILGELAAGRDPREALTVKERAPERTLSEWADLYLASRVDVADKTRRSIATHLRKLLEMFGRNTPSQITVEDVQLWIGVAEMKPASTKAYFVTLRSLLDYTEVEPNPARDRRVKLPRVEPEIPTPPTGMQVTRILDAVLPARWRLPLRTLEQTGMRVGEAVDLRWGDVDLAGNQFRIRRGKTKASKRWVAVPEWVMDEIALTCPLEDRSADRPVFPGFTVDAADKAMTRACRAAGVPHFSPHDLRHRYASVKIREGVPVPELAAQGGWSRKDTLLNIYSHVLMEEE